MDHITTSKKSIELLNENVETSKKYLANRSKLLKFYWEEYLEYKETLHILEKM